MRCSECGRRIEPVVAVDIDGTLGDYHEHFYKFAVGWLGKVPPNEEFRDNLGLDLRTYRQIKLAYRQGGMKRTMPVFFQAQVVTDTARKEGAEIWVTTTRPYNRLDNVDPDTQHWLDRHHVVYDHMLYDPDKYEELYKIVGPERVCAVLEDLPDQAERAARLFGHEAVLLRYNGYSNDSVSRSHYRTFRRMPDAADVIRAKIRKWYEQNG